MHSDQFQPQSPDCRQALDHLGDGILITDRDCIIVYCNPALCRCYDVPRLGLIGRPDKILLEKGYVDHSFTDLAIRSKKAVTYELTGRNKVTYVNTTIPVFDAQNHLLFVLQQIRSLESLEFYVPDSIPPPPSKQDPKKTFQPSPMPPAEFQSPVMQDIYKLADSMATKNINILILGGSGTGKTQLAKRIHDNSARKQGPFVTINCSAIPDSLIESELFGYSRGAFSGASAQGKQGLVEAADCGTLFLDEIGDLPFSLQAKLLQFAQEKTYIPVGSIRAKQVDARIIAATNKDIPSLIRDNKFREDLYYRLSTVTITMPPLKNRREDVQLLLRYFTHHFNLKHGTDVSFSSAASDILCCYSWPGNIREMEHLIEFLILSCKGGYVTPQSLPSNITSALSPADAPQSDPDADLSHVTSYGEFIEEQERRLVCALYPEFNTSYKLSKRLAVSQSTASRLIRKYAADKK